MKKQFIESLQEGDVVHDCFVVVRKDLRSQQNGGKFLGLVFKDRTGEIGGILWQNAATVSKLFEMGDVVDVRGTVASYQDRLQIRVDQALPLNENEYEIGDLVPLPDNTDEIFAQFREILLTVENEWLQKLLHSFLDDTSFVARFIAAAAGKRWHHAYPGGLVKHVYEVAQLALSSCSLFPDLDRDLLLTAVFLHDIGKMDEMSHDLVVCYTSAGKLLGHLQIGVDMIVARINAIEGFPDDLRLKLLHCVLAHHGELVNGSPVVPKTLEAVVLYHCDNLDAQADAFSRTIQENRARGQAWSDYITLIDRQIWSG